MVVYWSCDKNLNFLVAAKFFRMWWPEKGSNRRGFRRAANSLTPHRRNNAFQYIDSVRDAELLPTMYGPPRDCKGEVWSRRQVCANVFGLYVEIVSPGHDELRAYPSL
jgi:hypothetical protein